MDSDCDLPFIAPYTFRVYIQNNDLDHLNPNHRLFLTDWNELGKGLFPKELKGIKQGIKGSRLTISTKMTQKIRKLQETKAEIYRRFYKSFKELFSLINKPTEKVFGTKFIDELKQDKKIGKKMWMFNFLETCDQSWVVMDFLFEKMIDIDFHLPHELDGKCRSIMMKWTSEIGQKEMNEKDICKNLMSGLLLLTQVEKKAMLGHGLIGCDSNDSCLLGKEEIEMLKGDIMKPLPKQRFKLGISSMFHALDNYSFGLEINEPLDKKDFVAEELMSKTIKRKLDTFIKYTARIIETKSNAKLCLTMKELMLPSKFSSSYQPGESQRHINVSSSNIYEEGGEFVYSTRFHNAKQVVLYLSFDDLVPVKGKNDKLKEAICVIDGNRSLQIALLLRLDLAFVNGIACGPKIEDIMIYNTLMNNHKQPILPCEKKVSIFPSSNNSAFSKDCIDVTCDPCLELCSRECIHDGFSNLVFNDLPLCRGKRKLNYSIKADNKELASEDEDVSDITQCCKKVKMEAD